MVMEFKLAAGDIRTWPVDLDVFQDVTGNAPPWYVLDASDQTGRYYGVCPWCDNPVQLINLVQGDGVPHGRHCNKRITGFDTFDAEALRACPYKLKSKRPRISDRRETSPFSEKIRGAGIDQFDRIVHVLRSDIGIFISSAIAERWLRMWLAVDAPRYRAANLRNIPWMLALFAPASNLFGQHIIDPFLLSALERHLGAGGIQGGRLTAVPGRFYNLAFSFDAHRVEAVEGGSVRESIRLRVLDMTKGTAIADAPVVYRRTINIDPGRFERLLAAGDDHPGRNAHLRAVARQVSLEFGHA